MAAFGTALLPFFHDRVAKVSMGCIQSVAPADNAAGESRDHKATAMVNADDATACHKQLLT